MRKKAEKKIRQAVSQLQPSEFYRIDQVRAKTDLIRKVFDKTILDMDRVGTIRVTGGDISSLNPAEVGNLITHGNQLYVYFKFLDNESESERPSPQAQIPEALISRADIPGRVELKKMEIVILEIAPEVWQQFERRCKNTEKKSPLDKLVEMIKDYNQKKEA